MYFHIMMMTFIIYSTWFSWCSFIQTSFVFFYEVGSRFLLKKFCFVPPTLFLLIGRSPPTRSSSSGRLVRRTQPVIRCVPYEGCGSWMGPGTFCCPGGFRRSNAGFACGTTLRCARRKRAETIISRTTPLECQTTRSFPQCFGTTF